MQYIVCLFSGFKTCAALCLSEILFYASYLFLFGSLKDRRRLRSVLMPFFLTDFEVYVRFMCYFTFDSC